MSSEPPSQANAGRTLVVTFDDPLMPDEKAQAVSEAAENRRRVDEKIANGEYDITFVTDPEGNPAALPATAEGLEALRQHAAKAAPCRLFAHHRPRQRRRAGSTAGVTGRILVRARGRQSHRERPGHRRTTSPSRAGPDDGPGEPEPPESPSAALAGVAR